MKRTIVILSVLALALAQRTIQENCKSYTDCLSQGVNACCAYYDDKKTVSQFCMSEQDQKTIFDPLLYNPSTKIYIDPATKGEVYTYCKFSNPALDKSHEYVNKDNDTKKELYPYYQPFRPKIYGISRDILQPTITSDMFYYPKIVKNWDEQWEKWGWTIVATICGADLIFFNNLWWFFYDLSENLVQNKEVFAFPSMYNNPLAEAFMSKDVSGPF